MIAYSLVTRTLPFYHKNPVKENRKVRRLEYALNHHKLGPEMREFISAILVHAKQRPSITEVTDMPWLK